MLVCVVSGSWCRQRRSSRDDEWCWSWFACAAAAGDDAADRPVGDPGPVGGWGGVGVRVGGAGMTLLVWYTAAAGDRPGRIVRALRGGPVFDVLADEPALLFGRRTFCAKGNDVPMPKAGKPCIVFAPLEALVDVPALLDEVVGTGARLIVDVHFPLPDPDVILAVQNVPDGGQRDEALDVEVQDLWRDPDRVGRAYDALRLADAIVWGPVGDFDPAHVGPWPPGGPMPDVKTVDDAVAFYRRLVLLVWELGEGAALTGWRRRWSRLMLRTLWLRTAASAMRQAVVIEEDLP